MADAQQVRVRCLGEAPSRPPRRSLRVELALANPTADDLWFALPLWLDEPLRRELTAARRVECVQRLPGRPVVEVHAEPPAALVPLAAGGEERWEEWEMETWSGETGGEVWVVRRAEVPGWGEIREEMAPGGRLALPQPLPDEPALLAAADLPDGSRLRLEPLATFPFRLNPRD